MEKLDQQLFADERLFEYVLVLPAEDSLGTSATTITKGFDIGFGNANILDEPYILILVFRQFESMEFRITNCFDKFAQTMDRPSIVSKYIKQASSNSVDVEPASAEQIAILVRKLKNRFQKLLKSNGTFKTIFNDQPQLCIADILSEPQPKHASNIIAITDDKKCYISNEMLLLKREVDEKSQVPTGKYRPVKHFPFRGTSIEKRMAL